MRRLALSALLIFATLACGATPAHAQTLSLAYKAGDAYHYKLKVSSSETVDAGVMAVPFQMDLMADETFTIKSVDGSGVADVTLSLTNVNLKMSSAVGGSSTTTTISKLPFPDEDLKVASDGRVISVNGMSVSNILPTGLVGGGYFMSAVLPDNPVKPGDTWSKVYDETNPGGTGSIHVASTSKYLRDEKVKGVNAAVVETTSTMTIDVAMSGPGSHPPTGGVLPQSPTSIPNVGSVGPITIRGTITTDVTSWIDPGSHRILRSRMSAKNDMTISVATAPSASPSPQPPIALAGPISFKGTQSLDLEPA